MQFMAWPSASRTATRLPPSTSPSTATTTARVLRCSSRPVSWSWARAASSTASAWARSCALASSRSAKSRAFSSATLAWAANEVKKFVEWLIHLGWRHLKLVYVHF